MKFNSEVAPELTHNALFKGSGKAYRESAYMQTPREHEEAIRKFTKERERQFIRAGMSPAQVANGKRRRRRGRKTMTSRQRWRSIGRATKNPEDLYR